MKCIYKSNLFIKIHLNGKNNVFTNNVMCIFSSNKCFLSRVPEHYLFYQNTFLSNKLFSFKGKNKIHQVYHNLL